MSLAASLIYWVIVTIWAAVLLIVAAAFFKNPRAFGTIRLLLIVVAVDTLRNLVENVYFGTYFGAQYGLFPSSVGEVLGNPALLIIPKLINIVAACAVLWLLLLRWLPMAARERSKAEADLQDKANALAQETEENRRLITSMVFRPERLPIS